MYQFILVIILIHRKCKLFYKLKIFIDVTPTIAETVLVMNSKSAEEYNTPTLNYFIRRFTRQK